jgi:transposase
MAVSISTIAPVAHLPLILGMLRKLQVASIVDGLLSPHPDNVISCGRGVEALLLAILDGQHALYKVGQRLQERGMLHLLQPALAAKSLNDYRLGQILDALFQANLNRIFSALALKALEVYTIPTPWIHHDTTTIALYGAYERGEEAKEREGPVPPRPAYGHSKDGREDLKQVLLSLGVSGDGGLPLRMGVRDGNTSDSTEAPLAIEECLELGLEGVMGIVADSKAYNRRTLGLCLERQVGLVTLVPRNCGIREELEAWGRQQAPLPLLLEKPGRREQAEPRSWHGQSARRWVEVEYAKGQVALGEVRFLVAHSSQLAQRQAHSYAKGQAKEAGVVAGHIQKVLARSFACLADAEAAILEYEGRGTGGHGRKPGVWRYHEVSYQVEAFNQRKKRSLRGRPARDEKTEEETRYRLRAKAAPRERGEEAKGWMVLATTVSPAQCSDVQVLETYLAQSTTVEPGFRWIKNPAAITPVWLEKPERIAALAMLTVVGLLVYALIQRQVRLYLQSREQLLPGNKGLTATPTGAVILSLFTQVMLVQLQVEEVVLRQAYGLEPHHLMVCDALEIGRSWYELPTASHNSPGMTIPP